MILVTGASGLLGANLVRALLDNGEKVRCLVNTDRRALTSLDVEIVQGDIRSLEDMRKAVSGAELVYHLAGLISLDGDWLALEAINVAGVRNVVEAGLEKGVKRLVHFSSIHAIVDQPLDQPVTEKNPRALQPSAAFYDRSKALGEQEIRIGIEKGLDAVILNPTGVIGPYDFKPSMFGEALALIARGRFPILVRGGFNWVDARDVAQAAIQAAAGAPIGGQYILGGEWHSVREIATATAKLYNRRPVRWYAPIPLAAVGLPLTWAYSRITGSRNIFTRLTLDALSSNPQVDDSLARREISYRSRPFAETIRDTLVWFAGQGMAPVMPEHGEAAGD